MSVYDYSPNPIDNQFVGPVYIGEGWLAPDVNNAIRQLMADLSVFANESGGGTVKTVDVTGGATGLTTTGGPYNVTGRIEFGGTLNTEHGGTGVDGTFLEGYLYSPGGVGAFTTRAGIPGGDVVGNIPGMAAGVTGVTPVDHGGTGQASYTNGQLLIGSSVGNTLNRATLTPGSGIIITNGPGTITITAPPYGGGGTIPFDDGTAATPSITFSNDPATGIFRNAASNALAFTTAGVERCRVNGQRFQADFTTAVELDRFAFQSSVPNGDTTVNIIPNGTATGTGLHLRTKSDPTNSSSLAMYLTPNGGVIDCSKTGTGALVPLFVNVGGTPRVLIDTAGKIGLGYTAPVSFPAGTVGTFIGNGDLAVSVGPTRGLNWNANWNVDWKAIAAGTGLTQQYDTGTGVFSIWMATAAAAAGGTLNMVNRFKIEPNGNTYFSGSGMVIGDGMGAGNATLELGNLRTADGVAFIDLHAAAGGTDFEARIARLTGANGSLQIAQAGTGDIEFYQSGTRFLALSKAAGFAAVTGSVIPTTDNTANCGFTTNRWIFVSAVNGTINTSDEREKKWLGPLTEAELAFAKDVVKEIGGFRWLFELAKADDDPTKDTRLRVGVRAQRVCALMEQHGLDWRDYGVIQYDEWEASEGTIEHEAGDRFSMNYAELALFIAAAQEQRLAALEALL